ncbi:MAG: transcriptional repressor [Blastocatellia bacterium]|nr:transcriptional repressor [Blastocatellia bacterium]
MMREELEVFHRHLQQQKLKRTSQRDLILEVFLDIERHLSVEELYDLVKQKDSSVGFTTVYRTMHLLVEAGLARQVEFNDGRTRYEHEYKHDHHDHLICTECSALIEFYNPEIERLQEEIAKSFGFHVQSHSHRLFGTCNAFFANEGDFPPYCQKAKRQSSNQ